MLLIALTAAAMTGAEIDGRWINPAKSVIIDIAPCGDARCGTVQWASDKAKQDARKGTDQLVGSNLLTELHETKPGEWRGRLFVPDQKLRTRAKLTLTNDAQLKVSGCAVLCKSQLWDRFIQPLPE